MGNWENKDCVSDQGAFNVIHNRLDTSIFPKLHVQYDVIEQIVYCCNQKDVKSWVIFLDSFNGTLVPGYCIGISDLPKKIACEQQRIPCICPFTCAFLTVFIKRVQTIGNMNLQY
jgi:hypothetical protein